MALTDQPYIPFYVDDWMSNVNLMDCDMESHGLMISIMCLMHKSDQYGKLEIKKKYRAKPRKSKQDVPKIIEMFATQLLQRTKFDFEKIITALIELIDEEVLKLKGEVLVCNRMVRDGKLSETRKKAAQGKSSGSKATKQYGKNGFLYLISDEEKKHKIGISVNPQNRLYRLRSDLKNKLLKIKKVLPVDQMGEAEDIALDFFEDIRDGEWIVSDYDIALERFVLLETKLEANVEQKDEQIPISVSKKPKKPTYADRAASYVIMFNKLTGKNLDPKAKCNLDLIIPILKKGYEKDDLLTVMSYKFHEWKNDPDNKKYIRISTLFSLKNFQKYLSDARAVNHKFKTK